MRAARCVLYAQTEEVLAVPGWIRVVFGKEKKKRKENIMLFSTPGEERAADPLCGGGSGCGGDCVCIGIIVGRQNTYFLFGGAGEKKRKKKPKRERE